MEETIDRVADEPGLEPEEINQPGLSQLREAVENHPKRRLPGGRTLRNDAVAGLNTPSAASRTGWRAHSCRRKSDLRAVRLHDGPDRWRHLLRSS